MPRPYWTEMQRDGGYEKVQGTAKARDGEWIDTKVVLHHRLLAVAWFGWDAVAGRDVHHRLPIPWLNVESNLLPITKPEHGVLTGDEITNGLRESVVDDVTEGFGDV